MTLAHWVFSLINFALLTMAHQVWVIRRSVIATVDATFPSKCRSSAYIHYDPVCRTYRSKERLLRPARSRLPPEPGPKSLANFRWVFDCKCLSMFFGKILTQHLNCRWCWTDFWLRLSSRAVSVSHSSGSMSTITWGSERNPTATRKPFMISIQKSFDTISRYVRLNERRFLSFFSDGTIILLPHPGTKVIVDAVTFSLPSFCPASRCATLNSGWVGCL